MAENSKPKVIDPCGVPGYLWIVIMGLAAVTYFSGLSIPLLGPDEPRYAQVAREMFQRGDWITPTLGGTTWFEKPALLYWLEIASFKIFGVSEFAARLGPAIFGVGTVAAVWLLGHQISTKLEQRNDLANWMALVASSSIGIMAFSHGASFDIVVTFPITASLVCFFIFDHSTDGRGHSRYLSLALFYVFIGVALLAKGLIGVVFPFAIVISYYLVVRRMPNRAFLVSLIWGTLVSLSVASAWYLPMYLTHGNKFISEFIIEQHFQRFTTDKYLHFQPFYFYLGVFPIGILPWLPIAIIARIKQTIGKRSAGDEKPQDPTIIKDLYKFAAIWIVVIVGFFSVSNSKLPGYVLPAIPAAAIICGLVLIPLTTRSRGWRNIVIATAITTFAVSIVTIYLVLPIVAKVESVSSLIKTADTTGHSSDKIAGLKTVSHSAEFYAAGRLLRDAGGKQKVMWSTDELLETINSEPEREMLVLVRLRDLNEMLLDDRLRSDVLDNNGVFAIAAVRDGRITPQPVRSDP